MHFLRLLILLAFAVTSLHGSNSSPEEVSPNLALARGLVNLYFSAPLIHDKMRDSKSWEKHTGLPATDAMQLLPTIWKAYRKNQRKASKKAYDHREIVNGDDRMPFIIKRLSKRSKGKQQALTISLHGGGDMPKSENDAQWKAQQERYPNAPGLYVCPRAPRDTWNQWHGDHVYPMIEELIETLLVHEDIDPNQIYLMGYSAGGYGAFNLGNAMPDRFAAVAASAAAPSPNQTPAEHWNNLALRFEIGEDDKAYNRVKLCRTYAQSLDGVRRQDKAAFDYEFVEHENSGHQISDQACASWLGKHIRIHRPKSLVWKPSTARVRQFYWLANDEVLPGQEIDATIDGNQIELKTSNVNNLTIRLDDALVDLDQPITVKANGMKVFQGFVKRELRSLIKTMEERGDPQHAYCAEVNLYIP